MRSPINVDAIFFHSAGGVLVHPTQPAWQLCVAMLVWFVQACRVDLSHLSMQLVFEQCEKQKIQDLQTHLYFRSNQLNVNTYSRRLNASLSVERWV